MIGIMSRTLLLFLQDSAYLCGRDIIYRDVITEIIENQLLVIWICGDRRVIGGGYTHKFFIELVGNLGLI